MKLFKLNSVDENKSVAQNNNTDVRFERCSPFYNHCNFVIIRWIIVQVDLRRVTRFENTFLSIGQKDAHMSSIHLKQ